MPRWSNKPQPTPEQMVRGQNVIVRWRRGVVPGTLTGLQHATPYLYEVNGYFAGPRVLVKKWRHITDIRLVD